MENKIVKRIQFQEKQVEMYLVNSSNIYAVGYDDGEMYVEFLDGSVYRYDDVPLDIWKGMLLVNSKGSYLHWRIKINDYDYEDVTGEIAVTYRTDIPNEGEAHKDGYMN